MKGNKDRPSTSLGVNEEILLFFFESIILFFSLCDKADACLSERIDLCEHGLFIARTFHALLNIYRKIPKKVTGGLQICISWQF